MRSQQRLFDVLRKRGGPTKVYGRDEELGLLQDAFDRVAEDDCQSSEVVLVHGPSGCGKSAIVKALKQWTNDERGDTVKTFFGTGKYDQLVNNEPFAAIVAASNELCESVLKAGPQTIRRFNDRFRSMVDGDATVLSHVIPALAKLLQEGSNKNNNPGQTQDMTQDMASATQAFTRFKQLWRSLLLAISCCTDVIVFFLDDVQWADTNSLDFIHTMAKATTARNILFICAFRDDATVEKTQEERIRWCFSLKDRRFESLHADVALDNLHGQATFDFVTGILYGDQQETDKNRVAELSNILHDHTNGNAFFILYYLDYLSNIELLNTTNNNGTTWEWDLSSIANQSCVPTSIADLLSQVIDRLSDDILQVLTVAAHVGFEFSSELFQQEILANYTTAIGTSNRSLRNLYRPTTTLSAQPERVRKNHTNITGLLQAAIQEGLLEDIGCGMYAFPHDQIQQALCNCLSDHPQEQQQLHLSIGKAMLYIIEADQAQTDGLASGTSDTTKSQSRIDTTLFVAVDNMNKGSALIDNRAERDGLVRLNYNAALAALGKSAIEGAVQYIRAAVSLLPLAGWQTQYELTLDVYSLAARLEHNAGNASRCRALIDVIQANSKTVLDKLPSYFTKIDMLGAQQKLHEALTLGSVVLKELGEIVSPKPGVLGLIFELRRATKLMKKTKAAGFTSLGLMTDPKKEAAMSVLASMFPLSFILGTTSKNLTAIIVLRMTTLTCLYGLSPYSPYGIVGFAFIQVVLGDFVRAQETAQIALDLIDRIPGAEAFAGRTCGFMNGMIAPWVEGKSLADIHPEYIRTFHGCMGHGDIDQAFYGSVFHLAMGLIRGTPIKELNADFEKYTRITDEYQVNQALSFTLSFWRPIRMLTGKGDRTIEGDHLDVTGLYKSTKKMRKSEGMKLIDLAFEASAKILLGTYGDNLEEDERSMGVMMKISDSMATHFATPYCSMTIALGCMVLYNKTRLRKYNTFQRKMIKTFEKWCKKKAPIAMAPYMLLVAEAMANKPRRKTWEDVQHAYLEAMEVARHHGGFVFVEAYGYEKLAKLAEARSDGPKARFYLQEALATYTGWGATAKIVELTERLEGCR